MTIEVECEQCFSSFQVSDDRAGKRIRCKECGEPVTVPAKGKSARAAAPAPRPAAAPATRKKRPKPAKKSQSGLYIGIGVAAVVGVALLVVVAGFMFAKPVNPVAQAQPNAANTDGDPVPSNPATPDPAAAAQAPPVPAAATPAVAAADPAGTATKAPATAVPTTAPAVVAPAVAAPTEPAAAEAAARPAALEKVPVPEGWQLSYLEKEGVGIAAPVPVIRTGALNQGTRFYRLDSRVKREGTWDLSVTATRISDEDAAHPNQAIDRYAAGIDGPQVKRVTMQGQPSVEVKYVEGQRQHVRRFCVQGHWRLDFVFSYAEPESPQMGETIFDSVRFVGPTQPVENETTVAVTTTPRDGGWVEFEIEKGGFSVELPKPPVQVVYAQPPGSPRRPENSLAFSAGQPPALAMQVVQTFGTASDDEILAVYQKSLAALNPQTIEFAGKKCLEAIERGPSGFLMRRWIIHNGGATMLLCQIAPGYSENDYAATRDRFFNSFKLKK